MLFDVAIISTFLSRSILYHIFLSCHPLESSWSDKGRYILCLGSNREAVRLSGVNTKKWEMLAYIICGTLVGIASLFFVAAYTTVQPGYGDQYNNEAIAGCVMGGTSMAGGLASISGTIIGVFIIALLQEGILALGFTKDYQLIITGVIVIVAVFSDVLARRRKN